MLGRGRRDRGQELWIELGRELTGGFRGTAGLADVQRAKTVMAVFDQIQSFAAKC